MRVSQGVIAAFGAPIFEATGFLEWDVNWKEGGGSPFALNLFKCSFTTMAFFAAVCWDVSVRQNLNALSPMRFHNTGKPGRALRANYVVFPRPHQHNTSTKTCSKCEEVEIQWHFCSYHYIRALTENFSSSFSSKDVGSTNGEGRIPSSHESRSVASTQSERSLQSTTNEEASEVDSGKNPTFMGDEPKMQMQGSRTSGGNFATRNVQSKSFTTNSVPMLVLSSALAIIIGDSCELEALRLIGARRVLIVYTMRPFGAFILAFLLLDEGLSFGAITGMVLSMAGVLLVIVRRPGTEMATDTMKRRRKSSSGEVPVNLPLANTSLSDALSKSSRALPIGRSSTTSSISRKKHEKKVSYAPRRKSFSKFELLVDFDSDDSDDDSEDGLRSHDQVVPQSSKNSLVKETLPFNNDVLEGGNIKSSEVEPLNVDRAHRDQYREVGKRMVSFFTGKDDFRMVHTSPLATSSEQKGPGATIKSTMQGALRRSSSISSVGSHRSALRNPRYYRRMRCGYILSFCNVMLDAYGAYLIKKFGTGMTAWEISLIRYGFAAFVFSSISLALRMRDLCCGVNISTVITKMSADKTGRQNTSPKASGDCVWYRLPNMSLRRWVAVSVGVIFVTFLCPALSSYALLKLDFTMAVTLLSLTPLYSLPLAWWLKNDKPSARACLGTFVAVAGVLLFCMVDGSAEDF